MVKWKAWKELAYSFIKRVSKQNLRNYPEALCSLQKNYLGENTKLRDIRLCQCHVWT